MLGLEIRGFDIGPAHGQESRPLPGSYTDHSFFYAGTKIQFWGHFSSTDILWYNRNTQGLKPQSVASYFWGLSIFLCKMGGKFSPDLKESWRNQNKTGLLLICLHYYSYFHLPELCSGLGKNKGTVDRAHLYSTLRAPGRPCFQYPALQIKTMGSWAWCYRPVIPAPGRQRQED